MTPSGPRTEPRVRVERVSDSGDHRSELHDATFWGLRSSPKSVPSVWLYDERGSRLFDEITRLPEYYLTRREHEILVERAREIAERTGARTLVELGSGTSEKTRRLLDALVAHGTLACFMPLDVSEEVLRENAEAIAERYPTLSVHALVGDFERDLAVLPREQGRLIAFLGSTIGNLEPESRRRLFSAVADALGPSGAFLLGLDLVKHPARIEAAYDDAQGVTEAFLRNGLEALNRELGADFDQARFVYAARWDAENEWVDIGFRARSAHRVRVLALDLDVAFEADEPLRFEISAKFRRSGVVRELAEAGLALEAWWTDHAGDFALALARRAEPGR